MEGVCLSPLLRGERRDAHANLAWEHIGTRAIRDGDWKLVARRTGPWALYDLSKDRGETNDLAGAHPERVAAMEARWNEWAKAKNVLPAPGGGRVGE
jgi:arylsulfatase